MAETRGQLMWTTPGPAHAANPQRLMLVLILREETSQLSKDVRTFLQPIVSPKDLCDKKARGYSTPSTATIILLNASSYSYNEHN